MRFNFIFLFFILFFFINTIVFAQQSNVITMQISVTVEEVFSLSIEEDSIEFELVPLGEGTGGSKEAMVVITSNIGEKYQIILNVEEPFIDRRGGILPPEAVRLQVANGISGGQSRLPGLTSLGIGERVIFTSNDKGDSDSFVMHWNIYTDKMLSAGMYSTTISIRAVIR